MQRNDSTPTYPRQCLVIAGRRLSLPADFCVAFCTACFVASMLAGRATLAQSPAQVDRIWYQPAPVNSTESSLVPKPLQVVAGTVVEVAGNTMAVQVSDAVEPTFVPVDRLVWIQPSLDDKDARLGLGKMESGEYAESINLLIAGIQSKPEVWKQQWLLAHLAIAALETEKFPSVIELVGQLEASNPPVSFYGLLPIRWTSRRMSPSAIAEARKNIDAPSAIVRLVAASWLLNSPDDRVLAEQTLQALAQGRTNRAVSAYAEVLSWRRTPVPQIGKSADGWLNAVDRLPILMQAGPLLTVADRLQASGDGERAREIFLAIKLLYKQPRTFADQANAELEQTK